MKKSLFSLVLIFITAFANSCKDKDEQAIQLDFRPVETENVIAPPPGIERVAGDFTGYTIPCGQEAVFTISSIDAALGVLTVASYKHPTAANCNIKTEITRINVPAAGETAVRYKKIERDLSPGPGGAFTEIMEIVETDSIKVKIRCLGAAGGACIFDLKFRSIKEASDDNPPPAGGNMSGDSNPDGGRTHVRVNPAPNANPCTTKEMLLNTLYVDVDKAWPLTISIRGRSLCECDDFIVRIVKGGDRVVSKATGNGNEGPTHPINMTSSGVIRILGRCDGQVEPHQCKGDALFTITQTGR